MQSQITLVHMSWTECMLMRENKGFLSFAFDSAHVKYCVWNHFNNPSNILFSPDRDWSKYVTWPETGEPSENIPQHSKLQVLRKKIWRIRNSQFSISLFILTFLNRCISVKTSPTNTKLGDFVNLAVCSFWLCGSQAPQAQNTWCMRQLVYIENCMGK